MGRYDKIRVFNGSSFVQPSRIRVFNGSGFSDLGTNDSDSKVPLYVFNGSKFVRATLNKQINTHYLEFYTVGQFRILPVNQWGINPTQHPWSFSCTMEKTENSDVHIFKAQVDNNSVSHITLTWMADGRIRVQARSNIGSASGTLYTIYSNNAVGANVRTYLRVYWNKGSKNCNIIFGGVTTTKFLHSAWEVVNSNNIVGDARLKLYGDVSVTGVKYKNQVLTTTFNASSVDVVHTSQRASISASVVTPSYTTTSWV